MKKKGIAIATAVGAAAGAAGYAVGKQKKIEDEPINPHRPGFYEKYIKRMLDIVCSGVALVVLSPLMLITALLVRVKLGSPIIFTQERTGMHEKIFKLYKFRTMMDDRDENGELLPDEERLIKFGKFLRSTSLDELPELYNILKGDMSVVGPRPLPSIYDGYYTESQKERFKVRGGLVPPGGSLAQKPVISWDEQFRFEAYYANHVSSLMDIKVILGVFKILKMRKEMNYGEDIRSSFIDECKVGGLK